eukprot:4442517-Pleurochrysis_carterae.AAC.4
MIVLVCRGILPYSRTGTRQLKPSLRTPAGARATQRERSWIPRPTLTGRRSTDKRACAKTPSSDAPKSAGTVGAKLKRNERTQRPRVAFDLRGYT